MPMNRKKNDLQTQKAMVLNKENRIIEAGK